ncbi:hypothetical protein J437_LFUL009661 [Ladona fulva]|uniref:Uncharacterized protein n=1 Tax=Ladona fulva TaxID=123851 RepID=A0A8K0P1D9_LADFU|nr:hypothetical protein J437_LFUL009661 [Ladona fulva]
MGEGFRLRTRKKYHFLKLARRVTIGLLGEIFLPAQGFQTEDVCTYPFITVAVYRSDYKTGTSALFFAAQGGFLDIARQLMDAGSPVDSESLGNFIHSLTGLRFDESLL